MSFNFHSTIIKTILITLVIFSSHCFSSNYTDTLVTSITGVKFYQDTTPVIVDYDSLCFIVGTQSDYISRFEYVEREEQIDRYYPYEEPLVNYLTEYIRVEFDLELDSIINDRGHRKTYSSDLSEELNEFYEEVEYDDYEFDKLIADKFDTRRKIYSFLAGVYYRYGRKLDSNIYGFFLSNSLKQDNCFELIKSIGCDRIYYQRNSENIPVSTRTIFKPTRELKAYLDLIENERVLLEQNYREHFNKNNSAKTKWLEILRFFFNE